MYKEYMIRYPGQSAQLLIQMIDCISMPDVKLHKKVIAIWLIFSDVSTKYFFFV